MPETGDFIDVVSTTLCPTLSRSQAGALLAATVPVGVPTGETVFREGEPGKGLFFFVAGQVDIVQRRKDGTEQSIGVVSAPSVLGEISLIIDGPHTATARALSHCEFRFLSKEQFRRRMDANDMAAHRLVVSIAAIIARRLLRLDAILLEMAAGGRAVPGVEDLEQFRGKLVSEWSPSGEGPA